MLSCVSGISDSFAASTSAANSVLIDMETVALGHCGQNNEQGKSILFGSAYSGNKTILLDGIKDVTQAAEQALKDHEDHKENHSSMARVLLIISTFLIVSADLCTVVIAAWMEALSVTHHKDMKDSEDESKFMKKLLSMIQSALAANAEAGDNQKMESSQANQREAPELDEDDELDFVKIAMSI